MSAKWDTQSIASTASFSSSVSNGSDTSYGSNGLPQDNFSASAGNFNVGRYEDVFGTSAQFSTAFTDAYNFGVSADYRFASNIQTTLHRQDTSPSKMRMDAINNVRDNSDYWQAWDLQQSFGFADSRKLDSLSIVSEEAPPPYSPPQQSIGIDSPAQQEVAPRLAWFVPIIAGVVAGSIVGNVTHAAWQGAATVGGEAVASAYHDVASDLHNEYLATQVATMPGEKYAGHFNYQSSMAALNDARDQAAPWLNWGAHAAINHFKTENTYDKMEFRDNNGYALSIINE